LRRVVFFIAWSIGCSGASPDPGRDASLLIANAQFTPGLMPGDGAGPPVMSLNVSAFTVAPGAIEQPLLGTLGPAATAVAFQLAGDRGWWLITAGVPDTDSPTLPTFNARMSFARTLQPGKVTLVARAVDDKGRFGAASSIDLTVANLPQPDARLTISLTWASPTDLDLHVVDPAGAEIWSDAPTSASGGALDLDSNAECVIDGRDRENVRFADPPSGHYRVRVDTFSLCGQSVADWRVTVTLDGASLGEVSGQSVDADTQGSHQRGSGREVLGFDVP
jgi:hypothetical protein